MYCKAGKAGENCFGVFGNEQRKMAKNFDNLHRDSSACSVGIELAVHVGAGCGVLGLGRAKGKNLKCVAAWHVLL